MSDTQTPRASSATQPSRQEAWSRHWGSGALHSCAESGSVGLGEGFASFWRPLFLNLPTDARVLELGSGNGVLPWSALQWLTPFQVEFDAVDLASLSPNWWHGLPPAVQSRIRFHSGVAMEQLPFPAAQFNVVISQFAFEYGERERSVASLRKVARPGATLALVCHHAESLPVRLAAVELGHLDALLEPRDGLLICAGRLAPWFAQAQTESGRQSLRDNAVANLDRQRFNVAQDNLSHAAAASACPDVIHDARAVIDHCLRLSAQGATDAAKAALDDLARSLEAARLRLRDLRSVAMDEEAAAELLTLLGLEVTDGWRPLRDRGELMAWSLIGRWPG